MNTLLYKILLWSPLGIYLFPRYEFNNYWKTSLVVLHGFIMGIYITTVIILIIKKFK
jgi:hypothetical protein